MSCPTLLGTRRLVCKSPRSAKIVRVLSGGEEFQCSDSLLCFTINMIYYLTSSVNLIEKKKLHLSFIYVALENSAPGLVTPTYTHL